MKYTSGTRTPSFASRKRIDSCWCTFRDILIENIVIYLPKACKYRRMTKLSARRLSTDRESNRSNWVPIDCYWSSNVQFVGTLMFQQLISGNEQDREVHYDTFVKTISIRGSKVAFQLHPLLRTHPSWALKPRPCPAGEQNFGNGAEFPAGVLNPRPEPAKTNFCPALWRDSRVYDTWRRNENLNWIVWVSTVATRFFFLSFFCFFAKSPRPERRERPLEPSWQTLTEVSNVSPRPSVERAIVRWTISPGVN